MDKSTESTENAKEDLSKAGTKAYSTAFRTSVIGGIVSFALVLLAVLTLFVEGGDSAGPGFFIFGFLALAVLIISSITAILINLAGVVNGTIALNQSNNTREKSIDGITKNISLILGIGLVLLIVLKLLTDLW